MIPKMIHFTWFSNDPYPEKIQKCIDSWKQYMPDYEIIHWDMNRIKDIGIPFLKEALAAKKWAFAADYIRLYAVYHYGGIYLDTDVQVYKSFDTMLDKECFIGRENSWHFANGHDTVCYLGSHCFGAVKGHRFIGDALEYYNSIQFLKTDNPNVPNVLKQNITIIPYIQAEYARKYGYNWNYSAPQHQLLENGIEIYPCNYFDGRAGDPEAYCVHLAVGSWREEYNTYADNTISWKYKIEWRIIALLKKILRKHQYDIIKIT